MRISELAEQVDLPVATVKYYLREGLLPPGRRISATRAEYDDSHVTRLRLLRALRDYGQVPVGQLRALVTATEAAALSVHEVLGAACRTLAPTPPPGDPPRDTTRAAADALIERAGWTRVAADAPDRDNLANVLDVIAGAGAFEGGPERLAPYLEAADVIGRYEVGALDERHSPAELMRRMVLGQVLFGRLFAALRRLAQEHHSAVRFGTDPGS